MIELVLKAIGWLILFPFRIIQVPFRLVLKILVSPRIRIWPGGKIDNTKARQPSTKKKQLPKREREVLENLQQEWHHQQLHGAPQFPNTPQKRNWWIVLFAIVVILVILIAFIFGGYHI